MPSHFWPQLKDMPAHLSLDGHAKEYEFPDLKNCTDIKCEDNLFSSLTNLNESVNAEAAIDTNQIEHLQEDLENHKSKMLAKE